MADFYPISYSGLTLYEDCPYRFYRQKISKEKVKGSTTALEYGNKIHGMLEDYVRKNTPIPSEFPSVQSVAQAIDKIAALPNTTVEAERTIYLSKQRELLTGSSSYENFYSSYVNSKLDLTVLSGDTACIYDYKTGKSSGNKFQLDMQAACLFAAEKNVTQITAKFIYIDQRKVSDTFSYDRDSAWSREMEERFSNYEWGLKNSEFDRKQSYKCKFCPVLDCSFNKNENPMPPSGG